MQKTIFIKKIRTESFFYWFLLPIMLGKSLFSIGCMERQRAVILESIWERYSIIMLFPA